MPDDPFNRHMVPGYDDYRWSYDMEDMYRWVPKEIQEQYGRVVQGDGWVLELDVNKKDEIIAAMKEYGYKCMEARGLFAKVF